VLQLFRVIAALALAACGRVAFEPLDRVQPDALGACSSGSPSDGFDVAGPACGTWGVPTTNGLDMTRTASALEITPNATPGMTSDFAGCTVNNYDLRQGAMVEVSAVLGGNMGYTNITFDFGASIVAIQVGGFDGMIYAYDETMDAGHRPWDAASARFWRLRVEGTQIRAEVSPNAGTWTELFRRDAAGSDLTAGQITFGAGRDSSAASGTARFESVNLCP
jgi:hypothetical protein